MSPTNDSFDPLVEAGYVFSDRYPQRGAIYEAIASSSAAVRRRCPVALDLAYGAHPRERLDLFAGRPGGPLFVFLHGGYWRSMDKSSFSYVADAFLPRGISVAVVGYPLATEVGLAGVVASAGAAVQWLASEVGPARGAPIALGGHSAGGHLAAMVACARPRSTVSRIVGCITLSGIFDLLPLLHTSIGSAIALRSEEALTLSPIRQPRPAGWLLAAVGSAETPAFQQQTARYTDLCRQRGADVEHLVVDGANHYSMLEALAPGTLLVERMQARLGPWLT